MRLAVLHLAANLVGSSEKRLTIDLVEADHLRRRYRRVTQLQVEGSSPKGLLTPKPGPLELIGNDAHLQDHGASYVTPGHLMTSYDLQLGTPDQKDHLFSKRGTLFQYSPLQA